MRLYGASANRKQEGMLPLKVPWWSAAPFVLLLLSIALLPLRAAHFWEKNRNKAAVSLLFAGPVAAYLLWIVPGGELALQHGLWDYASFIALLATLYVISGGIVLEGDLHGRPIVNTSILAMGAVLANFIGTTGASMLLIRPFLRINLHRKRRTHLPVLFIFIVSNTAGLLTPLGDPPLFLGFIKKVDFFWTATHLWQEWLVVQGILLGLFFFWDTFAGQASDAAPIPPEERGPLRLRGAVNFILLGGVVGTVLAHSWLATSEYVDYHLSEIALIVLAISSLLLTPRGIRKENAFTAGPIIEVAVLFAGIFVTMVPALELLKMHGHELNVTEPWQYFWLSGSLSSFLDNAPTYVTFASLASGSSSDFSKLTTDAPLILAAISCGSVFMGANTYIGNGPNFMVKAITEERGVPMPSFFGYMLWSCGILLPVFGLVTYLFFV